MKRALTKQEERALWLCHHDSDGYITREAAKEMKITQRRVQQLLQSVKRKIPHLFPILTERQKEIRDYINEEGFSFEKITELLGISKRTIAKIVETMRKKGVYFERRKPVVQYQDYMDSQIVEKF